MQYVAVQIQLKSLLRVRSELANPWLSLRNSFERTILLKPSCLIANTKRNKLDSSWSTKIISYLIFLDLPKDGMSMSRSVCRERFAFGTFKIVPNANRIFKCTKYLRYLRWETLNFVGRNCHVANHEPKPKSEMKLTMMFHSLALLIFQNNTANEWNLILIFKKITLQWMQRHCPFHLAFRFRHMVGFSPFSSFLPTEVMIFVSKITRVGMKTHFEGIRIENFSQIDTGVEENLSQPFVCCATYSEYFFRTSDPISWLFYRRAFHLSYVRSVADNYRRVINCAQWRQMSTKYANRCRGVRFDVIVT